MAAASEPPMKIEDEQGAKTPSQDVPPDKVHKDNPGSAPEEAASDRQHEPIHLDVKVEVEPFDEYEMEALEQDTPELEESNLDNIPAVGTYKQIAFEEVMIKNEETELYDSDPEMQMVIDEEALEFSKISAGNSRNYDADLGRDDKADHYENILQKMTDNNDNVIYYICGFCIKLWDTLEPFIEHARSAHTDKNIIYVAQNKSSLTEVRLVHASSIFKDVCPSIFLLKYKCSQCNKHFTSSDALQGHIDEAEHPGENLTVPIVPSAIYCGFCENCFLTETDFVTHDNCVKILYCPCGVMGNPEDMQQHWTKCKELAGDLSYCPCERTGEKTKMVLHLNNCKKYAKVFTRCLDCPSVFYSQPKLKRHIALEHSSPKIMAFQTTCCKLQLASQEELDEHYQLNEKSKRDCCLAKNCDCGLKNYEKECRHTCFACGLQFTRVNLLEEHMKLHNLCMLYHCKRCTNLFGNALALSKHMAANKLKDPFTCNCGHTMLTLCEYSTHKCERALSNALEKETDSMDKVMNCGLCQTIYVGLHMCPGQRLKRNAKYSCIYCTKRFPNKLLLNAHETWNRQCDVSCNHCGVEIESKCFDNYHKNVCGTTKKVYPCNICNKQFCNVNFLLAHVVRYHKVKNTGEDVVKYKCNVCSALLKNYMSFRQHRKNKHPGSNEGFTLHTEQQMKPEDTEDSYKMEPNKTELKKSSPKHPRSLLRDNILMSGKTYSNNRITAVPNSDRLLVEHLKSNKVAIAQPSITKIHPRLSIRSSIQPITPSTSQQIEYPVIKIVDEPNVDTINDSDKAPKIRADLFSDMFPGNTIDLINDDTTTNELDGNQKKASPPTTQGDNPPIDQPQPKIRVNIFPSVFGNLLTQMGAMSVPGAGLNPEDPTVRAIPTSPGVDIKPIIATVDKALPTTEGGESIENVFKSFVPTEVKVKEEIKDEPMDDDEFQMLDSTEMLKEELLSDTEELGESVDDFIASTQELSFPTSSSCPNCKEHIEIFSQHKCSLNVYRCDLCNFSALTLTKYTRHYRNHGFRSRQCPACLSTVQRHSMVTHLQMHLAKNYNCPLYELRKRYKIVPLLKTYMCTMCHEDILQVNLITHWEGHVLKDSVTKATVVEQKKKNEEEKEVQSILKIEEQRPTNTSFKEGLRLDREGMMVVLQQLVSPRKRISSCSICCKDFQRMSDMKRHLIEHLVAHIFNSEQFDGVFRCEICAESFTNVLLYKKHMREHANLTLYQCDLCDKAFSDSSNYSKHRKVHDVTYMQCDTCKRKFFSRKMLEQHMEFHIVSPPLPCPHCDRVFYYESTLRRHLRNHDTTKPRAIFRCSRCPSVFDNMKNKWDHQWLEHSIRKVEADCPLCDEGYRNVRQLRYHLRTVHKEASLTLQEIRKENRKKQNEAAGS